MKLDWIDIEELAAVICGMDDSDDSDAVEQAVFDKFGISMEQLHKLVEALLPYTIKGVSALTNTAYHGFVKDGSFICKAEVRT